MQTSVLRSDLFKGQSILIIGGATGLGFAMTEQLASLGATLFLGGRRGHVVEEAAKTLQEKYGVKTYDFALDIRDAEAVNAMIDEIWKHHGGIDGLINSAASNFSLVAQKHCPLVVLMRLLILFFVVLFMKPKL